MSEPLASSALSDTSAAEGPGLAPAQEVTRSERPLQNLLDDFRALPFDALFPLGRWLGDQPWRMRCVQALLFFALFPLSLAHLWGVDADIHDAAWAIGTYFALLWGYVLWALVQPGQLKRRNLLLISLFTAVVGVFLVLTLQKLPFISALYTATEWHFSPVRLLGFVGGVGLLEEAVKLLPVFWLAVKLREISTPREAAFYAGVSGLAFGVAEAVAYSIQYTELNTIGMAYGVVGSGNYVVSEFLRLITLPFLHCVFSGIAGYYLGLSLLAPQRRTALLLLGIGVTAVLHGLYDFFAGGWLGLVVAGVTILTFVAYLRSAEHITQHITGQSPMPHADAATQEVHA